MAARERRGRAEREERGGRREDEGMGLGARGVTRTADLVDAGALGGRASGGFKSAAASGMGTDGWGDMLGGDSGRSREEGADVVVVDTVTLEEVLAPFVHVHLLDMDVQGMEVCAGFCCYMLLLACVLLLAFALSACLGAPRTSVVAPLPARCVANRQLNPTPRTRMPAACMVRCLLATCPVLVWLICAPCPVVHGSCT